MRNLFLAFAGIFLGIVLFLPGAARGEEMTPASGDPCLKYLPKDWDLVGNVDFKSLFAFAKDAAEAPQAAAMNQYMQLIQMFTGIDVAKELDYTTYFVCGDMEKTPKLMAAIRGTFNGKVVVNRFVQSFGQNAQTVQAKNGTVYATATIAFCLTNDGTLLVGDPEEVATAADTADADRAAIPDSLKHTLDHTNAGAIMWLAGQPKAVLEMASLADWRGANAELVANLGKMDCCSIFFDEAVDGILFRAPGNTASHVEAEKLSTYLNDRKNALLTREGSNVFGFSIMNISEIETRENQITATLPMTPKSMEQIWRTLVILKPGSEKGNGEQH